MPKKNKICFLLSNDASRDPRVTKEVMSATQGGFESIILAYYWKNESKIFSPIEKKDGYKVVRGIFDPSSAFLNQIARIFPSQFHQFATVFNYYWSMAEYHIAQGLKIKPQIVHANDLDTLYAGYVIKKKTGAKLVYDAHEIWTRQGLVLPKIIIIIFGLIERFLIGKVDAFISVNESLIVETEKMYHRHLKVIKTAILNCPKRQKTLKAKPIGQKIRILYQGGCFANRGIEQLCLSARYLPPKVLIVIRALGDPKIIEDIEVIRKKYNLENMIEISPPVSPNELVKAASLADIGVIANQPNNINNYLVLPNKIFEYMTAGLAIACSNFPEMKKILNKYHNGVLFNPEEPKSIAKAITKLLTDEQKLFEMKKNSLEAAQDYNWENEEKKLIEVYEKLSA